MPPADPRKLSKYETNDLFRVVEASGVPITQFKLTTRTPVTIIRHPKSGSSFGAWKDHHFPPGTDRFQLWQEVGTWRGETSLYAAHFHRHTSRQAVTWVNLLRTAGTWVNAIRQSITDAKKLELTPDLWAEHFENRPFTVSEQTAISAQIEDAKASIKTTYQLTGDQISRIDAMLDRAAEASKRIDGKDWVLLLCGAVSSLVLTDTITPQIAQHIIMMIIHGLSHLFGFGGTPRHIPPGG